MLKIFIGYDPHAAVTYHVCSNSIIRHASQPVAIIPLALNLIQNYTETHTDGSNQFIYSRFLIPYLTDFTGWALFIDGDMILRSDITELWELCDETKAVMVVKHDYKTRMSKKYLGAKNENYPRKNWSSVVLWNCGHPANAAVTPEFIQSATGAQVHRFTWLIDDLIGELPNEWNWLPDEYGPNLNAKLLHYTLGAPCFKNFATTEMANEWHTELILTNHAIQI